MSYSVRSNPGRRVGVDLSCFYRHHGAMLDELVMDHDTSWTSYGPGGGTAPGGVYLSVHNNPINAIDPLGLAAQWHHQAAKKVFDPADKGSYLNYLRLKLEKGVDIHSAKYGWEIENVEHAKLHSNNNPFGDRWENAQKAWLKEQKEIGITTITQANLDRHLEEMKQTFGILSPEGKVLIGHQAKIAWAGTTAHYTELAEKGALLADNVTAPERLSRKVYRSLADDVRHGILDRINTRAALKGLKVVGGIGATYAAVSGFSEARADGAPLMASIMVAGLEVANPTPWSTVEIKESLSAQAEKARDWASEMNQYNHSGIRNGLDFDPYDFAQGGGK